MSNIETKRHSYSHVLAAAVLEMFPEAKLAIGPAIDNGFYYDFDLPRTLIPEDLPILEDKMRKIIKADFSFEKTDIPVIDALKEAKKSKQIYKAELIEDLESKGEKTVSFYRLDGFVDLCAGPHVENTKELDPKAFKLASIAGAYWKGSEKNKMLQRIYGVAFDTQKELEDYEQMMEEAKKRDHRKLGKELGLFVFSDLVGPGLPLYTFKGTVLRNLISNYSRELRASIGYQEVHTPNLNKAELFKVSGHYDKYKDDMLEVKSHYSDELYYLKPMNCPQHTQIFASEPRSYKDMPVRISDFANLYRDEKPGELSGLTRLRAFSQDDGHSFCTEDQIRQEFLDLLGVVRKAMERYEMSYYVRLSLRDEKNKSAYLGDDKVWEKSQKMLEKLLIDEKIKYVKAEGEAAFYGPKMDIMATDSLGREWQLSTIQIDFNMPARFKLEYTTENGEKKTPVMIHCAIVGSPERFMAIILEHYSGALPAWLSPVQVALLPVADRHVKHCETISKNLTEAGIRVSVDDSKESVGKKIRNAEMAKAPYMLVIGDKEIESGKFSVRSYADGDLGLKSLSDVIKLVLK